MILLGIETSCDETTAAVVEDGRRVRSLVIASSQADFATMGGVIPEQAARRQVECIVPVIEHALKEANIAGHDLDAIAVTRGPGLLGSLLVGTTTARLCADVWNIPIIGVHHTFGHLSSTWIGIEEKDTPHFPILTLSASGGHTELWYRTTHTAGTLLGRTRDDAAGEAFDKGAMLLGLPYPGGPAISKVAAKGNIDAFPFPSPLKDDASLDFSYSGLKTALRYTIRDLPNGIDEHTLVDLAASYEHAICRHLVDRCASAAERHPDVREVHVVGGVAANTHLRELLREQLGHRLTVRTPLQIRYCTDNAAMIAAAGYFLHRERGERATMPFETQASLLLQRALE